MPGSHKVKKAIIMAAGTGKRLLPLTLDIPKPLIRVNGIRMIDSIIEALHFNGIYEIYVVVGHLKEQFYEWADRYHDIKLVENPYYKEYNNISSLYVAREYLGECIILDGDQIINNPKALDTEFDLSGYNAVWCENETKEWLMDIKDGIVRRCSRNGGKHGWRLISVSRWTKEDGKKLSRQIEIEFKKGNTQLYWDDVPMFCYFNDYKLGIYEIHQSDVIEIDSLGELIEIDSDYRRYKNEKKAGK